MKYLWNHLLHYLYNNVITLNKSLSVNASSAGNNSIRSNNLVNFNAYSQTGNSIYGNSLLNTVNGFGLNDNSYGGSCAKICHYSGSNNTFVASILDYTGYSITSNTLGAWKNGHFNLGYTNNINFGGNDNGGLLTIEAFSAVNVNISSIRGFCNIKAGTLQNCKIQIKFVKL